jgi:hypothetical protein
MGAEFSIMSVDELIEVINLPIGFSMKRVGDLSEEIASSLKRELSMVDFYMIDKINRSYFNPLQSVFGKEFANKFPTQAVFEVDEAGKCLALNRPTAAVFHLIRTMEVGILATSRCLQIADPIKPAERNWGRILEKIKRMELKKKAEHGGSNSRRRSIFEALYASLDAVKNPWRNATMHVENKYTDDESEHIFAAVRGFMKKLASRCDENGEPYA